MLFASVPTLESAHGTAFSFFKAIRYNAISLNVRLNPYIAALAFGQFQYWASQRLDSTRP